MHHELPAVPRPHLLHHVRALAARAMHRRLAPRAERLQPRATVPLQPLLRARTARRRGRPRRRAPRVGRVAGRACHAHADAQHAASHAGGRGRERPCRQAGSLGALAAAPTAATSAGVVRPVGVASSCHGGVHRLSARLWARVGDCDRHRRAGCRLSGHRTCALQRRRVAAGLCGLQDARTRTVAGGRHGARPASQARPLARSVAARARARGCVDGWRRSLGDRRDRRARRVGQRCACGRVGIKLPGGCCERGGFDIHADW